jgi:hypothetical protein
VRSAVAGFDGLNRVYKRLFQNAPTDGFNQESEQMTLEVLSVAHHKQINVRLTVGPAREVVDVAGRAAPYVGVCRL